MGNWIDCVRSRKTPNASAEIGFRSAIAVHMANLAYRHQKCHPDSEGVTLKTVPAIPSYCSLFAVRWLVERFSRRYQYARNRCYNQRPKNEHYRLRQTAQHQTKRL